MSVGQVVKCHAYGKKLQKRIVNSVPIWYWTQELFFCHLWSQRLLSAPQKLVDTQALVYLHFEYSWSLPLKQEIVDARKDAWGN